MKKFFVIALVCFSMLLGAQDSGFKKVEKDGYTFQWKIDGDILTGIMSAPTTGWIAVGFEPGFIMGDAEIIIGYVDGDKPVVEQDFADSPFGHKPITKLGGTESLKILSGKMENGKTEISFTIPVKASNKFEKNFVAGKDMLIMYAWGANGVTDLGKKHVSRGKIKITL